MKVLIYDPNPVKNEYVSQMFLEPMISYACNNNINLRVTSDLHGSVGETLVCNTDHLTPDVIQGLKCKVVGFNCVDSAAIAQSCQYHESLMGVHKIMMLSGIQTTNTSLETTFNENFDIIEEPRKFLHDAEWDVYSRLHQKGILKSLPYVPWSVPKIPPRTSFQHRRNTALFMGGNHLFRFIAYLKAMSEGFADKASGFATRDYFNEGMAQQFRYCQPCRETFRGNGGRFPYTENSDSSTCQSEEPWGDGKVLSPENPCHWNNRCPKSFYWLARKFNDRWGGIDFSQVDSALNHRPISDSAHLSLVSDCMFYADSKWTFTINMAQRFWQAASVGTINLVPKRTADQEYFPNVIDGVHYKSFKDDFSGMNPNITEEEFNTISNNAFDLFDKWIRPTEYRISTNLLKHIFDEIS